MTSKEFFETFQYAVAQDFSQNGQPAAWAEHQAPGSRIWGQETRKIDVDRLPPLDPVGRGRRDDHINADVSGNGSFLAVSAGTAIHLFDLNSGQRKRTLRTLYNRIAVHFHPEKPFLVAGADSDDSGLRVYNLDEELERSDDHSAIQSIAPDVHNYVIKLLRERVDWTDKDVDEAQLQDPLMQMLMKADVERQSKRIPNIDGRFLCFGTVGTDAVLIYRYARHSIGAWNLDTQTQLFQLDDAHTDTIMWAGMHPSGDLFATVSWDRTIKFRSISDGSLVRTLDEGMSQLWTGAFSPNGDIIAIGCGDKTVKIWDVETSERLHVLDGFSQWVRSIAFSPSGHQLAAGSGCGVLKLFSVPAMQVEQTYEIDFGDTKFKSFIEIRGVKFDRKGRLGFTLSDGRVLIRDPKENLKWEFERPKGHDHDSGNFLFLPNIDAILKTDMDNSVRIWSLDV
jgi:WD40 repeat protein